MTSFSAACGYGRSRIVIPEVPAARSVTVIAFTVSLLSKSLPGRRAENATFRHGVTSDVPGDEFVSPGVRVLPGAPWSFWTRYSIRTSLGMFPDVGFTSFRQERSHLMNGLVAPDD